MNNKSQIHLGTGDNLQDSSKYERVGKIVTEKKGKSQFSRIAIFAILFVVTARYWMPFLCPLVRNNNYSYQAFKSLEPWFFNSSELCELPPISP